MDTATRLQTIQPSQSAKEFVTIRKHSINSLSKTVFTDKARVISVPVAGQAAEAYHKAPLLLRLNTRHQLLSNIELFMRQASFQDSSAGIADASDMVVCMDIPDNLADMGDRSPGHSHVYVLGTAGCGKTRLLDEIVVRAIHMFSQVRIVQLDYACWSQMEPEDALLHLATQLKLAFVEDKDFEQAMKLQLRATTTTRLLCEQMLGAVQGFCQQTAPSLKVLFVVDNYKFPNMPQKPSLAQMFMQMADKFKSDFYVVAAVADPQGLPSNANIYKLRNGMRHAEAQVFIRDILVSSRNSALAGLLSNKLTGVIRIVRQYTGLNPHEIAMLFQYVHSDRDSDCMSLRMFAHLARQFVGSFNDPRYPLKLGCSDTTLQNIARRYNHLVDSTDLAKETVVRAYFNLQSQVPVDNTHKVFQQPALDHHPFVCLEHLENSAGLQFSSPRVAEYVLERAFGNDFMLEISRMLKTCDHGRYEMAYIASRWLSKTQSRGMPIFGHYCRNTLYRLNGRDPEESCKEVGWLSHNYGDVLGKVASIMSYSQASHQLALNRTNGLDFIYQPCNGQDAAQYVVLAMVQSDQNMRDIIDAWETKLYNSDGQKKNVKLTPLRRVLAGMRQVAMVRCRLPGNQPKQPLRLHLLGVRSTARNLKTCELHDDYGRYSVNVVDISSLKGLDGLHIRQFM
ncbi:hypothetical protein H4R22_002549 [Coemansia sp. RSA 1290]|nr:hypothetical protein H4R22_002549 [Coemansia sp. RSA 1290]